MTRKKLFVRGLAVGYLGILANIVYSLVSIPLALSYLGKEEFGLWAVILQIVSYLYLLDLGISNGISRILIDEKDNRANGNFGSILLTGAVAQAIIGATILCAAVGFGLFGAELMNIPNHLRKDFQILIALQGIIAGLGVPSRMLGAVQYAYQRQDLAGISQIGLFAWSLAFLFLGFVSGLGIYSMTLSTAGGFVWGLAFNAFVGVRFGLLPGRGEWGRPSWKRFRSVFSYSKDIFLMGLGWQLLAGSPVLILSRTLGLDAAAAWSVCSKPFQILLQITTRPGDIAFAPFSEMYVRGEMEKLRTRYAQVFNLCAALAITAFVSMACISPYFIELWTGGKVQWPLINFYAMGILYTVYAVFKLQNSMVTVTKNIRMLKYTYFLEGIIFAITSLFVADKGGVPVILLCGISIHLCITCSFGTVYALSDLNASPSYWLHVMTRPTLAFVGLLATGIITTGLLGNQPLLLSLVLSIAAMGTLSLVFLWFVALSPQVRTEAFGVFMKVFPFLERTITR